jgi:hypothetical protein
MRLGMRVNEIGVGKAVAPIGQLFYVTQNSRVVVFCDEGVKMHNAMWKY